jgi:hypothetical protein
MHCGRRGTRGNFSAQLSTGPFETDAIERNRGASGAALAEGKRRRLKPSLLSARADLGRRTGAPSGSIVVIVVVVGAKPTRLRVDRHFARLPIHGPGHIDISAVARDDDV